MSATQMADLDDCYRCGAARWEARRRADGDPYLRCGECGHTTSMPRQLQKRLPLARLPRDAERSET